jgi:hypothetical protein
LGKNWGNEGNSRAGTFEAYKILERDKWSGNPTLELWVAPEVRGLVCTLIYYSYGVEKREASGPPTAKWARLGSREC